MLPRGSPAGRTARARSAPVASLTRRAGRPREEGDALGVLDGNLGDLLLVRRRSRPARRSDRRPRTAIGLAARRGASLRPSGGCSTHQTGRQRPVHRSRRSTMPPGVSSSHEPGPQPRRRRGGSDASRACTSITTGPASRRRPASWMPSGSSHLVSVLPHGRWADVDPCAVDKPDVAPASPAVETGTWDGLSRSS